MVALAVAEEGKVLYVATELGLQASTDGGDNWNYIGGDFDALGAPPVVSLAVDPRFCGCLYAGTAPGPKGGLYVSRDGGRHWQRLFAGRRDDGVRAILVASRPGLLYISTYFHDGVGDELLVTNDGGQSWRTLLTDSGWHAQKFYALLPGEGSRLYVASSLGILVSTDGGEHFRNTSNPNSPVYGVAAGQRGLTERYDPLYVSGQRGLTTSLDGGTSWRSLAALPLTACHTLGPGSLAATTVRLPSLLVATRSLCRGTAAKVYALVAGQGTRSQSWLEVGAGLPSVPDIRLVVAGTAQPRVYALSASGLWSLDLPAPPMPATATPDPGVTVFAEGWPELAPSAPVEVAVPQGEVKETAVGHALDYVLLFGALPLGGFFALRWLIRRSGW